MQTLNQIYISFFSPRYLNKFHIRKIKVKFPNQQKYNNFFVSWFYIIQDAYPHVNHNQLDILQQVYYREANYSPLEYPHAAMNFG